jgi:hypothetical protein
MHPSRAVLLTAAAFLVVPATAPGQRGPDGAFPRVTPGQAVQGRLESTDPVLRERGHFRVFQVRLEEGGRYVVRLDADFDAYLRLARALPGGVTEILASDDDGGEGLNSRIGYTAPSTGTYLLVATSYGQGATGDFTLSVEAVRPPRVVRLLRSHAIAAHLLADAAQTEDGRNADVYTFGGRAGERVTLTMQSEDFDTYLILGRTSGGRFEELTRNDDGDEPGDGLNARIVTTLPADGVYTVMATTFSRGSEGRYLLLVSP